MDPLIRNVSTQGERSLDLGQVICGKKILIFDMPIYAPFRADDVAFLARLFVSDLIGHAFARPPEARTPVFLVIDEVQMVASEDLAMILEAGRELGCFCILSSQHLNQYKEEHSTRLYDAVMNRARTKLVLGGLSAAQLEPMVRELAIAEFDPMAVKDEIRANEVIPIETTRTVVTRTTTVGRSRGRTDSEGTGDAVADSQTAGSSWGKIESTAEIETKGTAFGSQSGLGVSQSISPDGTIVTSSDFSGSGVSTVAVTSRGRMAGQSHQASESVQSGRTVTRSQTKQRSENQGDSESTGIATSLVPFHAYLVRERVTSRQFWTEAEILTERLKVLKGLPNSIYVLKAAGLPTLLVRAPYVRTPFVSERKLNEGLAQVYGQPFFATSAGIQREEQGCELRLLGDGAPHVTVLDVPVSKKSAKARGRKPG